jgi:hypothetical protein
MISKTIVKENYNIIKFNMIVNYNSKIITYKDFLLSAVLFI